jgi:hypothetical protein
MNKEQLVNAWRTLPADGAAPFDYDALLDRQARRAAHERRLRRAGLGAGGALTIVLAVAAIWRTQSVEAPPEVVHSPLVVESIDTVAGSVSARASGPSLVSADTYVAVTVLEDRLAWFDDALSEARVEARRGSPAVEAARYTARVRELEYEREQLAQSLVQVKYAAALSAAM